MGQQGKKLDEDDQKRIMRLAQMSRSKTEIARELGVSRPTAYKYASEKIKPKEL